MVTRGGSVLPSAFPDEEFELYSIPAHDRGGPEWVQGSAIGSSKQLVKPGDVMISKIIPHLRRARIVGPQGKQRQIASGEWIVFRGDQFDPCCLRQFLLSDGFHSQFMNTVAGVGGSLVRARPQHVKSISVSLPPIDEQRRIAAILDHAETLRTKRRQVLAHLDSLTQAIFEQMFKAGAERLVSASEVMPTMRNGVSPATAGQVNATVLTLSAITRGGFDPTAAKVRRFAAEPGSDKRVTAQDFLMCRGNGNKALVGVGVHSPVDRPDLVFPDTVIAGRVDQAMIAMSYLEAAWKQRDVRQQIEAIARTTNGTFKVNQQTLGGVELKLPAMKRQFEFAEKTGCVRAQRAKTASALDDLESLFASLQSRAFSGQL